MCGRKQLSRYSTSPRLLAGSSAAARMASASCWLFMAISSSAMPISIPLLLSLAPDTPAVRRAAARQIARGHEMLATAVTVRQPEHATAMQVLLLRQQRHQFAEPLAGGD